MRYSFIPAVVIAGVVVLALAATGAQAKGPFVVEVSGGGLSAPVRLPGIIQPDRIFADLDAAAPALPRTQVYTVKLFSAEADPQSGQLPLMITWSYYPKQGAEVARVLDDSRHYYYVQPTFAEALDTAIAEAKSPVALPSAGGPVDDGSGLPWAVALGLGVAVLGAGALAGRRWVSRR